MHGWVRQLSPSRRRLAWFGGGIIAAIVIASGLAIWQLKQDARSAALAGNHRLGLVIAEQTARSLHSVDQVLADIERDLRARDGPGDRADMAGRAVYDDLVLRLKDLPYGDAFTLIGTDGTVVNTSQSWPAPALSLAGRDFFQHLSATPGSTVFIGEPVETRTGSGRVVSLARRLNGPDGAFRGVLQASISLTQFEDSFRTIGMPDGYAIALLRPDGTMLVRYPPLANSMIGAVPLLTRWNSAVAAGGGSYESGGTLAGPLRYVSVHMLRDFPAVVVVSISAESALSYWRTQATWILWGAVATIGGLLLMAAALMKEFRRHEASQAALRAEASALTGKMSLLQATLDHMSHGLVAVSPEGVVAVCNQRAIELLELPPALMRSSPSLDAVVAHQQSRQEFAGRSFDMPAHVDAVSPTAGAPYAPAQYVRAQYERERPNGTVLEVATVPLPGGGMVRTFTDVTAHKLAERRIEHLAYHDGLTQLCNRVMILQRLEHSIVQARETAGGVAVLYLDLDRFKQVNDTRGHAVGDRLLVEVAERLQASLRDGDTVGRMGGDEFIVIFPGVISAELAARSAERLAAVIRAPYVLDGEVSRIGVSVGVALFPGDGSTAEELLRRADSALYRAKDDGRERVTSYEPDADIEAKDALLLEQDLGLALELDQFEMAYQPIFDARTGTPLAFEALVRWRHPTRGLVPPSVFIPLAERLGTIGKLGRWVMHTACTEAATWALPVRLAINMSLAQFRRDDLEDLVVETLHRSGLAPDRLDLEVTEAVLHEPSPQVLAIMTSLRSLGVGMVLDDFGASNASISNLRDLPFQQIKIDRSFIAAMTTDPSALAVIRMVLNVASEQRLVVVAKGVEDRAQLEALTRLGCHQVQGYLLGYPQPPERTREYLWQANRRTDATAALL